MADTKLWTVGKLAKAVGVSPATITDALRRKQIPGEHIGRSWVVQDADAKAYVKARKALEKARRAVQP